MSELKKAKIGLPKHVATYRRLALGLPGVVEASHMGAADFRISEGSKLRIFATLAYADKGLGTLMLDPQQQAGFVADAPEYFSAVAGWGRNGATLVRLDAPEEILAGALATAHSRVLAKMQAKKSRVSKTKV